jgi:WD40 repeat protein
MNIRLYISLTLFLVFNCSFGQLPTTKKLNLFEDSPIITPNQNLVEISPDGQYLLTYGYTGFNIWDYKNEKVIKHISSSNSKTQIQFSTDGKYMACIEVEQVSPNIIYSVGIWQTTNWTKLINLGKTSKEDLSNFCFNIENTQIYTLENGALMNGSCTLKCYNLLDGKLTNSISLPEWSRFKNVKTIDKNHLLVSVDRVANLVDINAKKLLKSNEIITFGNVLRSDSLVSFYTKRKKYFQNFDTKLWEVKTYQNIQAGLLSAISNNGLFLAQMVKNERFEGLKVWDLTNQKELYSKELMSVNFNKLAISDDSKYVILGYNDKSFYKVEINDTPTVKQVTGNSETNFRETFKDMVFLENQKILALSTANSIKIYDLQNEKILKNIKSNSVAKLQYSSKNNTLITISENTNIGQLNLSDFTQKEELTYSFLNDAISSNNSLIAVGNKVGNKTRLFDMNSLAVINTVGDGSGLGSVSRISFSNDNLTFATNQYGDLTLWEVESGKKLKSFPNFHKFYIDAVIFSKDNKSIISSGGGDYKIRITDLSNINSVKYLEGHTKFVRNLCVSGDGKYLFSSSDDNTVKMWNLAQDKLVNTIFEGNYKIVKIILSSDSKLLYVLDENTASIITIPN